MLSPWLAHTTELRKSVVVRFWLTPEKIEAGELWLDGGAVRELQSAPTELEQKVADLFSLLRDPLYHYLYRLLDNRSEAEDVSQEAFLRLFTCLHQGQMIGNARAWVFRVAHNLAIDQLRKKSHCDSALPENWPEIYACNVASPPSAEQQLLKQEKLRRINQVLEQLSPQELYCLNLRASGLSYREIAEVLEVSASSVATFLSRGIKKITRAINE